MAGLVDEQLYAMTCHTSSTRSSSQHTIRSSLSHDANPTNFRPGAHKSSPALSADRQVGGHLDYFTLSDRTYQPGAQKMSTEVERQPAASKKKQGQPEGAPVAGDSASGSTTPRKSLALKDAAMAALNIQTVQSQPATVKMPPFLSLRGRVSSMTSTSTIPAQARTAESASAPKTAPSKGEYKGSTTQAQQPGSRVSEGSSSSSNYDDGSPLPSPATTPDTSRPQSSKGLPSTTDGALKGKHTKHSTAQNGLSHPPEAFRGRNEAAEGLEEMSPDDRWSRTAMTMNVDFDMHSESEVEDELSNPTPTNHRHGKNKAADGTLDPYGLSSAAAKIERPHSNPDLSRRVTDTSATSLNSQVHTGSSTASHSSQRANTFPGTKRPQEVQANERTNEQETKKGKLVRRSKPDAAPKVTTASLDAETVSQESNAAGQAGDRNSLLSAKYMSPIGGFVPSLGFSSSPFFVDFSEINKSTADPALMTVPTKGTAAQITIPGSATSAPMVGPSLPPTLRHSRTLPGPDTSRSTAKSTTSDGEHRTHKASSSRGSILKPSPSPQPSSSSATDSITPHRPHVLSAVPKHLQPHSSNRVTTMTDSFTAPIAKMFVECCSCRFYHDMPSKLYECMAKPDAVVEDRLLGISGAITTMVKCPWCHHNMSTRCCAGYAAVVYRKERLH
jgi:hypothetical protein